MVRKGLFFILLLASSAVIAVGAVAGHFILGPGRLVKQPDAALSFKPFTIQELLRFDVKIDTATSGTPIHSAKLQRIEDRVVKLRALPREKPIPFVRFSEPCVRVRVEEDIQEEYPSGKVNAEEKLLAALGLIPQKENLKKTLTDVLTEQIAGFYDPDTKKITIAEGIGISDILDELTMAHEITHALQDQNFKLDEPPIENDAYNRDNEMAVEALVEGDAMTVTLEYARDYVDIEKLMGKEAKAVEMSSEELKSSPLYIRRKLNFPYEDGLEFASAVREGKGEDALDAAFRDPPLSTEQIMHPEKYLSQRDNPRQVTLPDISGALGQGWKLLYGDTLGEFDVSVWFEKFSGLMASKDAAGGWGGNTVQYYQGPGKRYVVVNSFVWDTPEDAKEFFDGYSELIQDRFKSKAGRVGDGPNWYAWKAGGQLFYCGLAGDATLAVQAPDGATLGLVLENFPQLPAVPGT